MADRIIRLLWSVEQDEGCLCFVVVFISCIVLPIDCNTPQESTDTVMSSSGVYLVDCYGLPKKDRSLLFRDRNLVAFIDAAFTSVGFRGYHPFPWQARETYKHICAVQWIQ